MNTVTYGGARVPRTTVSQRPKVKKRKRFFARFMDALTESRRQQARRMIEDHAHLFSRLAGFPITTVNEVPTVIGPMTASDQVPLGRRR
jgi:hypothetical protein